MTSAHSSVRPFGSVRQKWWSTGPVLPATGATSWWTGSRWYRWHCERAGVEPVARFRELLREYAGGVLHGPFNLDARLAAGFDQDELDGLRDAATTP